MCYRRHKRLERLSDIQILNPSDYKSRGARVQGRFLNKDGNDVRVTFPVNSDKWCLRRFMIEIL